jgi:hypothetical protein
LRAFGKRAVDRRYSAEKSPPLDENATFASQQAASA